MYLLLKFFTRLLSGLSLSSAYALGRFLGALFRVVARKQWRRALEQLARSFPEKGQDEIHGIAKRVFEHGAVNYIEVFRWIGGCEAELDARVAMPHPERVEAAMARGKGVLVLTAHIGNFDLMGLWAAKRYPMTIISKDLRNAAVNRFWMEARARSKLNIVPAHNSYRNCLRVLKKNELLGFILDQNMIRKEGIFVEFFGRPACTTPGLAMLAAQSGAPVLPVFIVRHADGRHEIHVEDAIDPPPDRKPESIEQATQLYTRMIEDYVRRHPDQWIWMHRRWRTTEKTVDGGP
jgi:KDO2-lipid IV(A) lauroyltransferase